MTRYRSFRRSTVRIFFFFNDTATTEIYTLPLHDALPICRLQQSEISGGVIELSMSIAAKNGDALAGEIGHQQHQAAVIFNIRERDSHAGFCQPIHAVSDAHVQRRFPECTVSLIKPEEIGGGVVGDVDIGEAVAVEVRT